VDEHDGQRERIKNRVSDLLSHVSPVCLLSVSIAGGRRFELCFINYFLVSLHTALLKKKFEERAKGKRAKGKG